MRENGAMRRLRTSDSRKDMKHHPSELGLRRRPSTMSARSPRRTAPPLRAGMRSSTACPDATFFHRAGWQQVIDRMCSGIRTYFLYAERGGASKASCRSRTSTAGCSATRSCRCRSPSTAASRPAPRPRPMRSRPRRRRSRSGFGVEHLELAQRARAASRTGRRRISTSRSARRSCPTSTPTCWRFRASSARWCARESSTGSRARSTRRRTASSRCTPDNVHRHGTPALPRRYFETLQRVFGDDCEVLTVDAPERPPVLERPHVLFSRRGAALLRRRRRRGARRRRQRLQVLGADAPRLRARTARSSTTAAARGIPGRIAFKKNWGFEPQPLHYEYRLYERDSIPQNNPANPKYRAFIALWRRLPMPRGEPARAVHREQPGLKAPMSDPFRRLHPAVRPHAIRLADGAGPALDPMAMRRAWRHRGRPRSRLLAWIVACYWRTAAAIVASGRRSETFAHGFVVPPISGCGSSGAQRAALARDDAAVPMLVGAGAALGWRRAGWLLGGSRHGQRALAVRDRGDADRSRCSPVLGTRRRPRRSRFRSRSCSSPFPFGDFLMPQLMDWTADFTVEALRAHRHPGLSRGTRTSSSRRASGRSWKRAAASAT